MIIDKILEFVFNQLISISNNLPVLDMPDDFSTGIVFFTNALSQMFLFSYWINFTAIGTGILIIMSAYAIAFTITITKQTISYMTGGGGATK